MNTIHVCLDHKEYHTKPQDNDAKLISNRIAGRVRAIQTPADCHTFVKAVSKDGKAFCPSTFKDESRKLENFEQMQLSVLDFDGGITHDEVIDRAKKYDLPVWFTYDTFSSEKHNEKFRVVFLNDIPIADKRAAKITQNALVTMFPEADKCSRDISRMYYGGRKQRYYDESNPQINIESLTRNMSLYLKKKYGDTNYKRKIAEFAKSNGIALNKNKLLDISVVESRTEQVGTSPDNNKISPSSILLPIITNGEILLNQYYKINLNNGRSTNPFSVAKKANHNHYRSDVLKDVSNSCRLFKEFENGDRWLIHDELVGIATNLIQIETGGKKFRDIMGMYPDFYKDNNRWVYYLSYFKQQEYKPRSCNHFCPYCEKCNHSTNILSTVKPKRNSMERLANYDERFFSIKEAEEDVYKNIQSAVEANDSKNHIIKAQTAIGKTETFLRLMRDSDKRFLIAVPTNKLKNEVYERAKSMGISTVQSPSLDEIKDEMPSDVWEHIESLRKSGRHKFVKPYISETSKEQDIPCLVEHLQKLEKFENSRGHAITTHRRFLNMKDENLDKYDVIIIDEDIIFKAVIANHGEVTLSELKALSKEYPESNLAKKISKALFSALKHC